MTPSNVIEHDFGAVQKIEEKDENITDCSGEYHGQTIMHSKKDGFYLLRHINERLEDGKWEEIDDDQLREDREEIGADSIMDLEDAGTHRFRHAKKPITIDQAVRIFMVGWDDEAGLFDYIRAAFDKAGVEPLKM
jgi:hypothetical protein